VGYVYYQLTDDIGSGDHVGSFKSRVAALGPEVGYAFTVDSVSSRSQNSYIAAPRPSTGR
jgi:hypothetical protein